MKKLLLIGTIPETAGIGGVTIHVQRLLDYMNGVGISFNFADYKKYGLMSLAKEIYHCKQVHIHISNPFLQFILTLLAKILRKRCIVTIHGNLGRFGKIKNWVTYRSVNICTIPIVLNEKSLAKAKALNDKAVMIPAFIPPIKNEDLPTLIRSNLASFKKRNFKRTFSTNAFALSFDKYEKETYGITELLSVFKGLPEYGLVFSDPSSTYISWLNNNEFNIPENVLILNGNHSFYEIIKETDAVIRNTSTDGDSLSIKEALFLGKPVLCTDVVPRHPGCTIYPYGDAETLRQRIEHLPSCKPIHNDIKNGAEEIVKLYE